MLNVVINNVIVLLELKNPIKKKVTFRDKKYGKIIGVEKSSKNPLNLIQDVYLVDYLKFNFLNISQLCDKGNKVTFNST